MTQEDDEDKRQKPDVDIREMEIDDVASKLNSYKFQLKTDLCPEFLSFQHLYLWATIV